MKISQTMDNLDLSNELDKQKWYDYIYDGLEEEIYGRTTEESKSSPSSTNVVVQEPVSTEPKSATIPIETPKNKSENDTTVDKSVKDPCLEKFPDEVTENFTQVQKENEILRRRISELFKTAKVEMERKDRQVGELSRKLDDILLKRNRPLEQEDRYTRFDNRKRLRSKSPSKRDAEYKKPYVERKNSHRQIYDHHKKDIKSNDDFQSYSEEYHQNTDYNSKRHPEVEKTASFQENHKEYQQNTNINPKNCREIEKIAGFHEHLVPLTSKISREVILSNKIEETVPVVNHPNLFSKRMHNKARTNHESNEPKIVKNVLLHNNASEQKNKELVVTNPIVPNPTKIVPTVTKNVSKVHQEIENKNLTYEDPKIPFLETTTAKNICLISNTVDITRKDPRLKGAASIEQKMENIHYNSDPSEPQNDTKNVECVQNCQKIVSTPNPSKYTDEHKKGIPVARQRSKSIAEEKIENKECKQVSKKERRKSLCENVVVNNTVKNGDDLQTKQVSFPNDNILEQILEASDNNYKKHTIIEKQKTSTLLKNRRQSNSENIVSDFDNKDLSSTSTKGVEQLKLNSDIAKIDSKVPEITEYLKTIKIPKKSAEKDKDSRDILSDLHEDIQGSLRNTMQEEMGKKCNKILKDCKSDFQKEKSAGRFKLINKSDRREKSQERNKCILEKHSDRKTTCRGRSRERQNAGGKNYRSRSKSKHDSKEKKNHESRDRGRSRDRAHPGGKDDLNRSKFRHDNDSRHGEHRSRDRARSKDKKRDDRSKDRRDKSRHRKDDRDKSRHRSKSRDIRNRSKSRNRNKDLSDPKIKTLELEENRSQSTSKEGREKEYRDKNAIKLSLDDYKNNRIEILKNEDTARRSSSAETQIDLKDKESLCRLKSISRSSSGGSKSDFDLNLKDRIERQSRRRSRFKEDVPRASSARHKSDWKSRIDNRKQEYRDIERTDNTKKEYDNTKRRSQSHRSDFKKRSDKNRRSRELMRVEEMVEKLCESEQDISNLLTFEDENSIDHVLELYNKDLGIFSDDSSNHSKTAKALADREPEDLLKIKARLLAQLTNDDSLEEGEIVEEIRVTKDKQVEKDVQKEVQVTEVLRKKKDNKKKVNSKETEVQNNVRVSKSKKIKDEQIENKDIKDTKMKDKIIKEGDKALEKVSDSKSRKDDQNETKNVKDTKIKDKMTKKENKALEKVSNSKNRKDEQNETKNFKDTKMKYKISEEGNKALEKNILENNNKLTKMITEDPQENVLVTLDESKVTQMAAMLEDDSRMEFKIADSKIKIISHVVFRSANAHSSDDATAKNSQNITAKDNLVKISSDKSVQIDSKCGKITETSNEPVLEENRNNENNADSFQNSSSTFDSLVTSLDESNSDKPKKRIRPNLIGPSTSKSSKKEHKPSKGSSRSSEKHCKKTREPEACPVGNEEAITKKRITPKLVGSIVPIVDDKQISEFADLFKSGEEIEIVNNDVLTTEKLETEKSCKIESALKLKSSSESEVEIKREPRKLPIKKIRTILEPVKKDTHSPQNTLKKEILKNTENQENCKKNDLVHVRDIIKPSENHQLNKLDKKTERKSTEQSTRVTRTSREHELKNSVENVKNSSSPSVESEVNTSNKQIPKNSVEKLEIKESGQCPRSTNPAGESEINISSKNTSDCSKIDREMDSKRCLDSKKVLNTNETLTEPIEDKVEKRKQLSCRRNSTENYLETKNSSKKGSILSRVKEETKTQTNNAENNTEKKIDHPELTLKLIRSRNDSNNFEISTDDEKGTSERVPNPEPTLDVVKETSEVKTQANTSLASNNKVSRGKVMENLKKEILGSHNENSFSMDESSASKSPKIPSKFPSRGKMMDLLEKEVFNNQGLPIGEESVVESESIVEKTPSMLKKIPSRGKIMDSEFYKALQNENDEEHDSKEYKNDTESPKTNQLIDILKNDEVARKLPNKHISKGKYMIRIQHTEDSEINESMEIQDKSVTLQKNSRNVFANKKFSIGKRIDNLMDLRKEYNIDQESDAFSDYEEDGSKLNEDIQNEEDKKYTNDSTPQKKCPSERVGHNFSMPSMDSNTPIKMTPVKNSSGLSQVGALSSTKRHARAARMISIFGEDITLDGTDTNLDKAGAVEAVMDYADQSFKGAFQGNLMAQTPLWKQMELSDDSSTEMSELSLSYEQLPQIKNPVENNEKLVEISHKNDEELNKKVTIEEKQQSVCVEQENKKTFNEILYESLGNSSQHPSNSIEVCKKSDDWNPENISKILSENVKLKNPLKINKTKASPKKTKAKKRKSKDSPENVSPKRSKSLFPTIRLKPTRRSPRKPKKRVEKVPEMEDSSSEDHSVDINEENLKNSSKESKNEKISEKQECSAVEQNNSKGIKIKPVKSSGRKTPVNKEKLDVSKATPKTKKAVVTKKIEPVPTPDLNTSTENVDNTPVIRRRNSKSLSPGKGTKNVSKTSADTTPISLNKGNLSRRSTSGKNSKRVGGRSVKVLDETFEEQTLPQKIEHNVDPTKNAACCSPLVHFENMLIEKQSATKIAVETDQQAVELNHDGQIPSFPVLHIEDITFGENCNFPNKSLLNFVEGMNMTTSNSNLLNTLIIGDTAKNPEQPNLLTFTSYLNSSKSTTSTPVKVTKTQRCISFQNVENQRVEQVSSKNLPVLLHNSKEHGNKSSSGNKQNCTNTSSRELQNSSVERQNNQTDSSVNVSENSQNKSDLDSSAERKRKVMKYTFGVGIKRSRTRRPVVEFVD